MTFVCIGKSGAKCIDYVKNLCDRLNGTSNIKSDVVLVREEDPDRYAILAEINGPAIMCLAFEKNTIREIYRTERMFVDGNIELCGSIGIE